MLVPIIYMIIIFILSTMSGTSNVIGSDSSFLIEILYNFLHIPVYSLLALLWMITLRSNGESLGKAGLHTVTISLAYAAFIEFNQSFVPGRYATLGDFILNTIGCVCGLLIYIKFLTKMRKPLTDNR